MGFIFVVMFVALVMAFVILVVALFVLQIVVSFGQVVLTQMQRNQLKRVRENTGLRTTTQVGTPDDPWSD